MKRAIIMADIVDSGAADSKKLLKSFEVLVRGVNRQFSTEIISPLTITLGDEFQGVAKSMLSALDILFYIEKLRISKYPDFKLRFVVYFGEIDTAINKKVAHAMLGKGLAEARRHLNQMKDTDHRFLVISGSSTELDRQIAGALRLFQNIVDSWKANDSRLIASFLQYRDYKIVAKKLDHDIAGVWRRQKTLQISEFFILQDLITFLIKHRDAL
jgi:hypothetical protein